MAGRWWTFDRIVAVVQGVAGLVVVVLFLGLGLGNGAPDRTAFDRAFPFVIAALAALVTAWTVVRGLRRAARRTRPARPPRPARRDRPPRAERPGRRARPEPAPDRAPAPATGPGSPAKQPPRPDLSARGRSDLDRIVAVLDRAGTFAPRTPEPGELAEAVADHGEPVTAFGVLQGLHEANYWHPGFRLGDHVARLAFHNDQVEQDRANLRTQIDDLDRLAGDALAVVVHEIDVEWLDGDRAAPTRIRLDLDGEGRTLVYRGAAKYLSTVVHVEVARALRGSPVRLAGLASDAGMWTAALPSTTDLERLNTDLGAPDHERWEWLDEQEPVAAGGR